MRSTTGENNHPTLIAGQREHKQPRTVQYTSSVLADLLPYLLGLPASPRVLVRVWPEQPEPGHEQQLALEPEPEPEPGPGPEPGPELELEHAGPVHADCTLVGGTAVHEPVVVVALYEGLVVAGEVAAAARGQCEGEGS
jgi:hypothetical protein